MKSYYKLNGITVMKNGWTGWIEAIYKTEYIDNIRYDKDVIITDEEIENIIKNGKYWET
ncbi:MAG: hypothetical protein RLZZ577_86 [Bacteroidota bacterium]|jgi:hypothetical protein